MGGPPAATAQNRLRSKLLSSGTEPHNLEGRLQGVDPYSYLNRPQKRALEEARGFSQLFSVDCSSSSSDNKNEEEISQSQSVSLQRKRQLPGGSNGDPRRNYGWVADDQGQSMPYESVRPSAIDSGEDASEPARRMPASDSRRPPGGNPRPPPLPLPMGEIVEVEGGHIVRSTGRKDRHSKVYTAKGPRDRRVRLSASTAIQFYDLQDRLGYDRPSKAVAWLIEKAKVSIDELAHLPEIHPPVNPASDAKTARNKYQDPDEETEAQSAAATTIRDEHSRALARERARERAKERTQERDAVVKSAMDNNNNNNTQFSHFRGNFNLFSNATNINATHSLIQALQLQNSHAFHPMDVINPSDSISRNLLQASQQNFYPSLASQNFSPQFETPSVVFCEAENSTMAGNHHHQTQTQQVLFSGSAYPVPAAPSAMAISEHHHEFGNNQPPQRILRPYPWTNNNSLSSIGGSGDFGPFGTNVGLNNIGGGNQNSFALRGTLQSSSSPVRVRSAHDLAAAAADHFLRHHATAAAPSIPPAASGGGGFSGFRIPARIQGIDEHDDVKPSAASSTSQM